VKAQVRIALDQNFPVPILKCVEPFLEDINFTHIAAIDPRLSEIDDWQLIVALSHRGFHALASSDYNMLNQHRVACAAHRTGTSLILIESLGHDPIRATGALLLDLSFVAHRISPRRSTIFRIKRNNPTPEKASDYIAQRAKQMGISRKELLAKEQLLPADLIDPLT